MLSPSIDRRRLLGVAGAALAGTALLRPRFQLSDRTVEEPTAAWLRPHRTAGNAAVTSDPGPGDEGTVAWRRRAAPSSRVDVPGLALADDDLLVPADRGLLSLDPADGTVRWRHERTGGELHVRGDRVFVASDALSAIDRAARRVRWRYPALAEDVVCLVGNTLYCTASIDGEERLVALDAETGFERWRRSWVGAYVQYVPIAATDEVVVATYGPGRLRAFDAADGSERWRRNHLAVPDDLRRRRQVIATDDAVVAQHRTGTIAVLDAATGERRATVGEPWESDDPDAPQYWSTARLDAFAVDADRGRLYHARPHTGTISRYELDGATVADGSPTWRREGLPIASGLAVGGSTVYASTAVGLLALDAETGAERFRVRALDEPVDRRRRVGQPIVAGRRVFHWLGDVVYGVVPA